uniref:Uncharacterized protein n=1 Tax=Sphaerodactylus townsendi TaxID=933632 RepID=A0ACB8G6G0_9SAUR
MFDKVRDTTQPASRMAKPQDHDYYLKIDNYLDVVMRPVLPEVHKPDKFLPVIQGRGAAVANLAAANLAAAASAASPVARTRNAVDELRAILLRLGQSKTWDWHDEHKTR